MNMNKVPDKIWVREFTEGLNQMWNSIIATETSAIAQHEYIRKDALLEWAKEKYNEYKQMDEDFQGDVFIGNRHAFAEVIAKIESL